MKQFKNISSRRMSSNFERRPLLHRRVEVEVPLRRRPEQGFGSEEERRPMEGRPFTAAHRVQDVARLHPGKH